MFERCNCKALVAKKDGLDRIQDALREWCIAQAQAHTQAGGDTTGHADKALMHRALL